MRTRQIMVEVICCLLIMLFVYAAASKLMDYKKFEVQLSQSPMLTIFGGSISWVIPILEILIACSFVNLKFRLIGLYFSFSLLIAFSTYIFIILRYSSFIPCSCGGILEHFSWEFHLYFNLGFVLLSVLGILFYDSKPFLSKTEWR